MNLFGLNIVEHPLMPDRAPRMTLSHKVTVSEDFRREFDQWLLEFFGTERVAYVIDPGKISMMGGRFMAVSSENMAIIRNFA